MSHDARDSIVLRALPIVIAAMLASRPVIAATARSDIAVRIDAIVAEALREGPIAGASVAVVRGKDTLVARGYGYANIENDVPAGPDTVYHIDSITKHVTAGAVLQLVEAGKLSLDDTVTKYVPQLPASWSDVRIRHLLNHTSGSRSFTDLKSWGPQERLDIEHDEVLALVRDEAFDFPPGTSWRYNNTGFYLLGMIMEKVTGTPYADYMRVHLFEPLAMSSTRYGDFKTVIRNRANGYVAEKKTLVNAEPMSWRAPFAGGALCSTVLDLVRWEKALEHGALSPRMLTAMRAPTQFPDGTQLDYGLGTRLGNLGSHRIVGHTGTGGGFNNALERFPDDDVTIVVLTNTDGGSVSALRIATRIARLVLGVPAPVTRDLPVPAAEIAAYVGTYGPAEESTDVAIAGEGKVGYRAARSQDALTPLPYQGDGVFFIAPEVVVKMPIHDGKARWGINYVGGLFMDAFRRH